MDLLATGSAVKPGLPARLDDAASDNEKTDEAAIFEVFLGLALTVPSPDAVVVSGPEGKTAPVDATDAASGSTGNPATSTGNILPVALPVGMEPGAQPSLPEANGDDGAEARRSTPASRPTSARRSPVASPEAATSA